VLRAERSNLVQRELMLETIVENSPVSLVLIDNYCRVAYANGTARQLIGAGRTLEGQDFGVLMQALPSAMRQAFTSGEDGIFTMDIGGVGRNVAPAKERLPASGGFTQALRHKASDTRDGENRSGDVEESHSRRVARAEQYVGSDFMRRVSIISSSLK
jgi:PAS domain-containing protein